jgi:TRAP-type C4-dicarboxylate transport system substrate-binding protein
MKKLSLIPLVVLLVSAIIFVGCAAPAPAPTPTPTPAPKPQPVVLRAISGFPANNPTTVLFLKYLDGISKATNGQLTFEFKGGPEAIAARDQVDAAVKGTVDVIQTTASNIAPTVPEGLTIFMASKNATDLRKNGYFDVYNKYLQKKNITFVAYNGDGLAFSLFTKKTGITKTQDFKGLIMRSNANYDPFLKALGCSVLSLAANEVYSAMERGVADGYALPVSSVPTDGLTEVTKTYIQYPLWNGAAFMAMNLDSYNKLPADVQTALKNYVIAQEEPTRKFFADANVSAWDILKKAGVQFVKFAPDDEKYFLDLSVSSVWDAFIKANPVSGPELKKAVDAK